MTGWSFLVYVCSPVPVLLLFLLTLPLPIPIRKGTLYLTRHIIFFPLVGGLKTVHVFLSIALFAFVEQTYRTYDLRGRERPMTETGVHALKSKIWRSERNFWIALFTFVVWWMLNSYYNVLVKYLAARDENEALKKQLNPPQQSGDKKND